MNTEKEDITIIFFVGILILSGFASALQFELASLSFNLSQIVALVLLSLLILYHALNRKKLVLFRDNLSILIYFYLLINIFSSILLSEKKLQSLKGCIIITTYVVIYLVIRWSLRLMADKSIMVRVLRVFNFLSASFGLLSMFISILTGKQVFGVSFGHLQQSGVAELSGSIPSIQSFSVEPNVFAIITAVVLCINVSIYFLWKKTKNQLVIICILGLSILFSYTRSVYVSLFIAIFFIVILSGQLKLMLSVFKYAIIVLAITVTVFIFLPKDNSIKFALSSRAISLFDFQKGSGLGRVVGYQIGFEGFLESPLLGNGTLSAKTAFYNPHLFKYQDYMGSPGWLNGALIQSLHDTGIVGLLITLGIFIAMILSSYNLFVRLKRDDINKSIALGFVGGNIILIITSQLSSTLWISFPYIYWGVNIAFIEWCKKPERDQRHRH